MPIRSIEFYSGIGGMHYGLKEACPTAEVLAAFDINTTANHIYRCNFPETALKQNNIEAIPVRFLEEQAANLWTMSPPCQPFCKKGLQLWDDDRRSNSFLILLEKLESMSNPPMYLFLENVVGFEESSVHKLMVESLDKVGYSFQEYILSPMQFGIPNSRPRYYLLASRSPDFPQAALSKEPPVAAPAEVEDLEAYIDSDTAATSFLAKETLDKYGRAIDVVTRKSRRSACFTKSYGTYISGCGSYYCEKEEQVDGQHLSEEALRNNDQVQVRKLTPREVANLMCFPASFQQPSDATDKQMYKTLGNSVNVRAKMSRSGSEEDLGSRAVTISVVKDTGSKVEVMFKAHGLKKKKSLLNSIVTVFRKPHHPSKLLANGKFTRFELKETSLGFTLEVQTDKKKKKGNENRVDTFVCDVKRFPSKVNPDSAEFEVLEPASGDSFILLSLVKLDNLNTNWKEFMAENGTLDVEQI